MSELAVIAAKLDRLLAEVQALKPDTERPLTLTAFGQRVGLSRWTIRKKIDAGQIVTKGGRIPPSELRKFGL